MDEARALGHSTRDFKQGLASPCEPLSESVGEVLDRALASASAPVLGRGDDGVFGAVPFAMNVLDPWIARGACQRYSPCRRSARPWLQVGSLFAISHSRCLSCRRGRSGTHQIGWPPTLPARLNEFGFACLQLYSASEGFGASGQFTAQMSVSRPLAFPPMSGEALGVGSPLPSCPSPRITAVAQ